ncbi:Ig-like domain-containing protein, partial [uncultured Muribaculum sp.]
MKLNDVTYMRLILAAVAAFILAACASMGRPTGGEYDVDPPVYVQSNPAIGSVNFKKNHITIDFNENVQVEDVMNKVVVSPPQKNIPSITANGKRVTAELRDSMLDNTTYTIDFSDAIKDLNEGNTLDGFAIDFSTGDSIDSLRIAGMVFEARTLEPAQNMLVGVYSNLSDTAITTLPLERIGRTNQLGQFIIRGLKPGNYRIYALNDINRDYHWDRSEDVAFYDVTVSPYAEPTTVNDTLITLDGRDSIVTHPGTNYFPNDILLTWFNEGYKAQYLKDYTRPDRRRLLLNLAAPSDTFPTITLLNGPAAGKRIDELAILNTGMTRDTLEYFITDTALMAQDTMMLALHFLRTDTLQQLSWGDDTIRVLYREP